MLCGYHVAGEQPLTSDAITSIEAAHDRTWTQGTSELQNDSLNADALAAATRLHAVRFYENRESLARIVGKFLGEGFLAGLPAIVIATPEHRGAIKHCRRPETLSRFMVDGMPDAVRFKDAMIPLIELACRGRNDCVIRAYGEMVDVLWQAGQTAAAIRLEMLWNQLAQTHGFALLCGYSMGLFYKDVGQHEVRQQPTHLVAESGERVTLH